MKKYYVSRDNRIIIPFHPSEGEGTMNKHTDIHLTIYFLDHGKLGITEPATGTEEPT